MHGLYENRTFEIIPVLYYNRDHRKGQEKKAPESAGPEKKKENQQKRRIVMKKAFALILASAMALSLAACGSSKPATTQAAPVQTAAAGTQAAAPADASASKWPTGSVQFYVPANAGGGTDLAARIFTTWLNDRTGKGMVVTNQSEGSGQVATANVANAKPNGATLLLSHTGSLISAATGTISTDLVNGMTTLAFIPTVTNYCLVVNSKSDIQTIDDLIAKAKAEPGKVTFGVALGAGTHMMAANFAKDAGIEFNYVESGSDTEKVAALAGGHIIATLVNPNNAKQFSDSGDVRCLATIGSSADRADVFPDIPSLKELGYEHCTFSVDFVLWGPKDMEPADVQKIHDLIAEASEDPAVREQMANLHFPILGGCLGLEEGQKRLAEISDAYKTTLKEIGLIG